MVRVLNDGYVIQNAQTDCKTNFNLVEAVKFSNDGTSQEKFLAETLVLPNQENDINRLISMACSKFEDNRIIKNNSNIESPANIKSTDDDTIIYEANRICEALGNTGDSINCEVNSSNFSVDIIMNSTSTDLTIQTVETQTICSGVVNAVTKHTQVFDEKWKLRFFSPNDRKTLVAVCSLGNATNKTDSIQTTENKTTKTINDNNSYTGDDWKIINRYQVKNDLVKDNETGLMWMRCSLGQIWNNSTCDGEATAYTWKKAMSFNKNFNYADYDDWRLPTIQELKTLVYCSSGQPTEWNEFIIESEYDGCAGDYKNPTVVQEVFPATPNTWLWSSTSNVDNKKRAWVVNFGKGSAPRNGNKTGTVPVRLVRSDKAQTSKKIQSKSNPSFNCTKASTDAEHLICSNENLAIADVEMFRIYKQVLETTTDKNAFKREQGQWRRNYRDICKDAACMLNAYTVRIE